MHGYYFDIAPLHLSGSPLVHWVKQQTPPSMSLGAYVMLFACVLQKQMTHLFGIIARTDTNFYYFKSDNDLKCLFFP